jgi:hypothetical protein
MSEAEAPHPWEGRELEQLRRLLDEKRVTLGVLIRKMNTPGTPVYSHAENILPAAAILLTSFAAAVVIHRWLGAALLVAGCAWWWFRVRPAIRDAVLERTTAHVLAEERNFDLMWARGTITLFARMPDGTERIARKRDDWRGYVRSFHE